jgi:cell shape-determining protein MreC
MKLPSRPTSKQKQQTERLFKIVVIAVTALLLAVILPGLFSLAGKIVMAPIHGVNQWLRESESRLPLFIREQGALVERIKELENQLAVAESTDLTQQRLYEENVWLRSLLGAEVAPRIAAAVVARPGELPYDYIQIDRGEQAGVVVGAPVYAGKDNVIGVVVHTTATYSFVELFTSPQFKATAFISGANAVATVEGYGGGVARIRVPQGVPIRVGNLVHVPSLSPGVLGRIVHVENEPSQPEQFGYITLAEPISGIQYVAVGTDTVSPAELPVIEERIRSYNTAVFTFDPRALSVGSSTIVVATSTASTTP